MESIRYGGTMIEKLTELLTQVKALMQTMKKSNQVDEDLQIKVEALEKEKTAALDLVDEILAELKKS